MPYAANSEQIAKFQQRLIGTWVSDAELTQGGRPLSFNVMPLPQPDEQPGRPAQPDSTEYGGFILKNFAFKETIRFHGSAGQADPPDQQDPAAVAVVAGAPNRGGTYTQVVHALFYEQQIHLAEGPQDGKIVHVENGAWLHLGSGQQKVGPYGGGPALQNSQVLKQPPYLTIAKQIAVPHGNSVLALGQIDLNDQGAFDSSPDGLSAKTVFLGAPTIPDAFAPYPHPADIATAPSYDPYGVALTAAGDFENPSVEWTLNPNYPLQLALDIIKPQAYMHWRVTTLPLFGGKGVVTNIPFEQRRADVTEYWADYWLLSRDPNAEQSGQFEYLLYTQTALMRMKVSTNDGPSETSHLFPHVTSNAVKKVAGTPTQARQQTPTLLE